LVTKAPEDIMTACCEKVKYRNVNVYILSISGENSLVGMYTTYIPCIPQSCRTHTETPPPTHTHRHVHYHLQLCIFLNIYIFQQPVYIFQWLIYCINEQSIPGDTNGTTRKLKQYLNKDMKMC